MAAEQYLAHSARDGFPAQSYAEHTNNVVAEAVRAAQEAARYAAKDGALLCRTVFNAAAVHDLGKLLDENQKVLRYADYGGHLPANHVDAGVAWLKSVKGTFYSQLAASSHHRGLPDMASESSRDNIFRDLDDRFIAKTDEALSSLTDLHHALLGDMHPEPESLNAEGDPSVFSRLALSCLADADHSDTARHYGKYSDECAPALRAKERLEALDRYIPRRFASGEDTSERNRMRSDMYAACRVSSPDASIVCCDSPVGSGKTTAIMAHLLQQAIRRDSRRIFVILPFTNIIHQSVNIYRDALVLPGEDPERVVAELHHRADFQDLNARILTAQWRAPIVVTTAVAFFETLASNRPSSLRRLHELPGSVIFVDEAHAALPVKLLPLAWNWMQVYSEDWRCYWVLASGSLVKFWGLDAPGWEKEEADVPHILPDELRTKLLRYESGRISFEYIEKRLSIEDLVDKIKDSAGPRLVILNTVKNAAWVASKLKESYDDDAEHVMHLSTALTAEDREKTVEKVRKKLNETQSGGESDWTLVATSCVEAGIDFSFRTGFREISSLLSLLQAAGRINRNGEAGEAVIWSFDVREDELMMTKNPALDNSADILCRYFEDQKTISPQLSSDAIQKELHRTASDFGALLYNEDAGNFADIEKNFKVIDAETVLLVSDSELKADILSDRASWQNIQRKTVSVRLQYVHKFHLTPLREGIYDWNLGYDRFLGVMRGVLDEEKLKSGFLDC